MALTITKPSNGPKLRAETGADDINVDAFFAEIETYKAEFAFRLISVLVEEEKGAERDGRPPKKLTIPNYISQAFDFIKGN